MLCCFVVFFFLTKNTKRKICVQGQMDFLKYSGVDTAKYFSI